MKNWIFSSKITFCLDKENICLFSSSVMIPEEVVSFIQMIIPKSSEHLLKIACGDC